MFSSYLQCVPGAWYIVRYVSGEEMHHARAIAQYDCGDGAFMMHFADFDVLSVVRLTSIFEALNPADVDSVPSQVSLLSINVLYC